MGFRKISKIAAGVVSLSLALGTFGTFQALSPSERYTASAASEQEKKLYEYRLEDVYIDSVTVEKYSASVMVAPKVYGGYEPRYYSFELSFEAPYVEDEEGILRPDLDSLEKTLAKLKLLKEGITVSMTLYSEREYADGGSRFDEDLPFDNGGYYTVVGLDSLESEYIQYYGDINGDGVVDTFDTVMYRMEIAGTNTVELTESQRLNADINKDDVIDEEDLESVMDFVLGKTKEFNQVGTIRSTRLGADITENMAMGTYPDSEFAKAEMNLGVDLLKKCFDPTDNEKKNTLISPLSISAALSMTANGADGKTLEEMESVLGSGLTLDEINDYMAYYVSNLPDNKQEKLYLADSIWFRDDPSFRVYDSFLKKNIRYYDSEIYKTAFDDTTVNDVNSWVNENTRGMIPTLLKKGDLDPTEEKIMMMMLINTLYFENDWADPYHYTNEGMFTDYSGVEHPIERMDSMENHYYDLGDADAFDKPFAGGNYKFVGIMPKGKDIVEYVNGLDAEKLLEGLSEYEDPSTVDLYVMIPKFKYNYGVSLKKILPELGMESAFDERLADFSKINDLSVDGAPKLYIDDVLHKTRIEVTEKGVKAAAVTSVMMAEGAAMPVPKKEVHIELDKPFVYMILDKNNIPIFIGAASQLEKE